MLFKNKNVNGIYRVIPHLTAEGDFPRDVSGNIDESFDDFYIPCSRGKAEIYTTHETKDGKEIFVAYIPSRTIRDDITKNLTSLVIKEVNNDGDETSSVKPKGNTYETELFFYDRDIKEIAKLLKARTKGAKIKPTSDQNLPNVDTKEQHVYEKYDDMPKGWFNDFRNDYIFPIQRKEKIKATLVWGMLYEDFGMTKGINKKFTLEAKKHNYKIPHYIHKLGYWDAFEAYLKERTER